MCSQFFRYYKDEDEFDTTRVHYGTSVIGGEFISFIVSIMTARLVNRLDSPGLFKENSYKDLMLDLAQAQKVKAGDQWLYVQLPVGIQKELQALGLMPNPDGGQKRKPGRPKTIVTEVVSKRKPGSPLESKNKTKAGQPG